MIRCLCVIDLDVFCNFFGATIFFWISRYKHRSMGLSLAGEDGAPVSHTFVMDVVIRGRVSGVCWPFVLG